MKLFKKLLIVSFVLFAIGCSDDTASNPFDKQNMLEGYSYLITNIFKDFTVAVSDLVIAVEAIDENSTVADIENAQQKLKNTLIALQRCKPFDIGEIESNLYLPNIAQWPILNVEIETIIGGSNSINSNLLGSIGANQKGLFGMEYLLFNGQKSSNEILAMFTSEIDNDRRRAYLLQLALEVERLVTQMNNTWINEYQSEFLSSTQNGVSGSENRIYNESVAFIDEVLNHTRTPYDDYSNNGINPNLSNLIAYNSQYSIELLNEANKVLLEIFENGVNDGLADHLDFVNAKWEDETLVSDGVTSSFNDNEVLLNQISNLEEAILNNEPAVEELIESLKSTLLLYRSDLVSWLSLILLVSDNDGD